MNRSRALALWAAAGLAGALGFTLLHLVTPAALGGMSAVGVVPLCPLRRFLGIPCPGCGMTRALAHLAKGEWRSALTLHPLAPLLAAELVLAWAGAGLDALGRRSAARFRSWVPSILAADGALLVALWAGRLASGAWPR